MTREEDYRDAISTLLKELGALKAQKEKDMNYTVGINDCPKSNPAFAVRQEVCEKKSAPVGDAIDALVTELNGLEKCIAVLGDKLQPVLLPMPPTCGEKDGPEPVKSSLTTILLKEVERIRMLRRVVESFTARCEL